MRQYYYFVVPDMAHRHAVVLTLRFAFATVNSASLRSGDWGGTNLASGTVLALPRGRVRCAGEGKLVPLGLCPKPLPPAGLPTA